jgi:hypothetical protein
MAEVQVLQEQKPAIPAGGRSCASCACDTSASMHVVHASDSPEIQLVTPYSVHCSESNYVEYGSYLMRRALSHSAFMEHQKPLREELLT